MKHYLESKKFFVENKEEKLVYMVNEYETYANCDYLEIHLELVAGWDYVNPDENDMQGWVSADRFVEDIQYEFINQYFLLEGMKEALECNDYVVCDLEKMSPNLKAIIDNHNKN